ncbi:DinB family protein [Winogradskyella sp. 3972H.M.0a.05]|uniref:DinB family protein n=1 Tax=Winogradskyella sp. 3972H.M.0a.05 TaxID=2950277 RepID=UPI0033994454
MTIQDLSAEEFHPYYKSYIDKAEGLSLIDGLKQSGSLTTAFLRSIPSDKADYNYAEGKWTLKELVLHIIDAERVFAYRALRIARRDTTPLAGFEQNSYVEASGAGKRSMDSIIEEFVTVRKSTELLFENFSDEDLKAIGEASGSPVSTRALGFIIIGHETHHCDIIKERYL